MTPFNHSLLEGKGGERKCWKMTSIFLSPLKGRCWKRTTSFFFFLSRERLRRGKVLENYIRSSLPFKLMGRKREEVLEGKWKMCINFLFPSIDGTRKRDVGWGWGGREEAVGKHYINGGERKGQSRR